MAGVTRDRSDLARAISVEQSVPLEVVNKVLDAYHESIMDHVSCGMSIRVIGFGTFTRSFHKGRKIRNPGNGEMMDLPAMHIPIFKTGKTFKDKVKRQDVTPIYTS